MLATEFARSFVEDDDRTRFELLTQVLADRAVTSFETYPGETSPVELHAYVRAPSVSDTPIFACVLATTAVVEQLVASPPHMVPETASFQVIGEEASTEAIVAGLATWAGRVWPDATLPSAFRLTQWPEMQVALQLPKIHLASAPMVGAPLVLQAPDFPTAEELR